MKMIQAGILAAVLVLSLSACTMRNDWVDDSSYSAQQQKEKASRDEKK